MYSTPAAATSARSTPWPKTTRGNPIVIWEFDFDDAETGFLTAVTDRDGNVTTFERGVAGGDLVITGPFGQQTTITLDANGRRFDRQPRRRND